MRTKGFTLLEVLIALTILAIALLALIKTNTTQITQTKRVKEKNIAHWVMLEGIHLIQLGLISEKKLVETTQKTQLLGQTWYWRATLSNTSIPSLQLITIKASQQITGPFNETYYAFKSKIKL